MEWLEYAAKALPLLSAAWGAVAWIRKQQKKTQEALRQQKEGQMCLLRKDMLDIYYANRDRKRLRQWEAQNFMLMYESYKAMGGNSFIDEVYEHVTQWELEL